MHTIWRWLKRVGVLGGLLLALGYFSFCAYSLPRHAKVHVTGTEISRRDVELPDGRIRTDDVRYVMAEDLDGSPRMFRNEDTGWGWPPYFKFNSGDLAAQASNLATEARDETVLVTYYGFRIRMLSLFPNLLSMQVVSPDHDPIPWLTLFVVFLHLVLLGVAITVLRSWREEIDTKN